MWANVDRSVSAGQWETKGSGSEENDTGKSGVNNDDFWSTGVRVAQLCFWTFLNVCFHTREALNATFAFDKPWSHHDAIRRMALAVDLVCCDPWTPVLGARQTSHTFRIGTTRSDDVGSESFHSDHGLQDYEYKNHWTVDEHWVQENLPP